MSNGEIQATLKPSLHRLRKMFVGRQYRSVTRELQYEYLEQLELKGSLLDIGGGERANYRALLNCESYDSVNISAEMRPTWIVKPDKRFDIPKKDFDNVVSINTFEHVLDAERLVGLIFDVMKPGGRFIAATPFLYQIHGSPDDFFRPTPSWWSAILSRNVFKDIKITPLLWGPFSTGSHCSGLPGPFKTQRMLLALMMDILYARYRFAGEPHIGGESGAVMQNHALGYFVDASRV
jgi:SAM-dependent methyltransferase